MMGKPLKLCVIRVTIALSSTNSKRGERREILFDA